MASIRKRGSSYQITVSNVRDSSGKQLLETTTFTPDLSATPKQQSKALDEFVLDFERKVKSGKYLDGEKITFKEFTDHWLNQYAKQQLEATTLNGYKYELDRHIIPYIGHLKLSKIQPATLQALYNSLSEPGARCDKKDSGYSTATIRKILAIIRKTFATAVQWQIAEENPCIRVTPPKQNYSNNDVKFFTLEQTEIFLESLDLNYPAIYKGHDRLDDTGKTYHVGSCTEYRSIPTRFKVFFNMAVYTGMRKTNYQKSIGK